jgi:hypothetical protein
MHHKEIDVTTKLHKKKVNMFLQIAMKTVVMKVIVFMSEAMQYVVPWKRYLNISLKI